MMIKILYIADANSFHDVKWIKYFSNQPEKYSCYILSENSIIISDSSKNILKDQQIELLQQINPISISSPIKTIKSILKFRKLIKEINPDIIHVLFATPNALWTAFTNKPYIISTRGSDILKVIPSLLKTKGFRSLYDKFLYQQFKKSFSKAKLVTATSYQQIERLKNDMCIKNPILVRTGIEIDSINSINTIEILDKSLQDASIILSPRFMSPIYNIDLQVDSIKEMSNSTIEKYTFVFIKGRDYDKKYYQIIKNKLDDLERYRNLKYKIFDFVNQETLWMLLKKSSLCIMTPISDGTPNSALEAMATKTPLIIPPLEYDKDIFENTCLQLSTYSKNELKEKIEYALTSYPQELIETAYEKVNELGNNLKEMSKIEMYYKSIK